MIERGGCSRHARNQYRRHCLRRCRRRKFGRMLIPRARASGAIFAGLEIITTYRAQGVSQSRGSNDEFCAAQEPRSSENENEERVGPPDLNIADTSGEAALLSPV